MRAKRSGFGMRNDVWAISYISVYCLYPRRSFEEVPEELVAKRRRLLDAELELVERKRYLTEMKIKYWESKTKKLDSS